MGSVRPEHERQSSRFTKNLCPRREIEGCSTPRAGKTCSKAATAHGFGQGNGRAQGAFVLQSGQGNDRYRYGQAFAQVQQDSHVRISSPARKITVDQHEAAAPRRLADVTQH